MNKKVSITELMTETAVLTIGLTFYYSFYYWCWVRTDWKESYTYIQNAVAGGIICFIFLISYRVRKFHKEPIDELARANLKRCDSICLKIFAAVMVLTAFIGGTLGHVANTASFMGWVIMISLIIISILRIIIFKVMDQKGV